MPVILRPLRPQRPDLGHLRTQRTLRTQKNIPILVSCVMKQFGHHEVDVGTTASNDSRCSRRSSMAGCLVGSLVVAERTMAPGGESCVQQARNPTRSLKSVDSGDRNPVLGHRRQENENHSLALDMGEARAVTVGDLPNLGLF